MYAQAICADDPELRPGRVSDGHVQRPTASFATAGTFITGPYHHTAAAPAANTRPRGVSLASLSLQRPTRAAAGSVTATLALAHGASYPAADHRVGILLVDGNGQPLGIDYTAQRTTADAGGNVVKVTLTIPAGTPMPGHLKAYVMADVFPLAGRQLY